MNEQEQYEIIRKELLESRYEPNLHPVILEQDIKEQNEWLAEQIERSITCLLETQDFEEFCQAYTTFFDGLDTLEQRLKNRRFLLGDYVTDSDIRLYVRLIRYDVGYSHDLGPCRGRLEDYENLWAYARDLYQVPAFAHNTDFLEYAAKNESEEEGLDKSTYYELVALQTDYDTIWKTPAGREGLSWDPAHRFQN